MSQPLSARADARAVVEAVEDGGPRDDRGRRGAREQLTSDELDIRVEGRDRLLARSGRPVRCRARSRDRRRADGPKASHARSCGRFRISGKRKVSRSKIASSCGSAPTTRPSRPRSPHHEPDPRGGAGNRSSRGCDGERSRRTRVVGHSREGLGLEDRFEVRKVALDVVVVGPFGLVLEDPE